MACVNTGQETGSEKLCHPIDTAKLDATEVLHLISLQAMGRLRNVDSFYGDGTSMGTTKMQYVV